MKYSRLLSTAAVCCIGLYQTVGAESDRAQLQRTLARGTGAELPARAAGIVNSCAAKQRRAVTVDLVTAALALSPGAAPAIVSAIATARPEVAAAAAGTAAGEQPLLAGDIVRAAVTAAPTRAREIVAAVCRAAPGQYREIAAKAAQGSPALTREVLLGIAAAFPKLKPAIQNALKQTPVNQLSTSTVLDQARPPASASADTIVTNSTPARTDVFKYGGTPVVGPPYVPYSGTMSNVVPSTSGTVPRGGRNYAAP